MSEEQTTRVGFVGIGTIGKSMALSVRKGGFSLAVFETLERTIEAGYADEDFSSMLRANEAKADVRIRFEGYDAKTGNP